MSSPSKSLTTTTEKSTQPSTLPLPASLRAPASPDPFGTPMPFFHSDHQPKSRFHWNTNHASLLDQSGPRAVDSAAIHTGSLEDAESTSPPISDSDQPKSTPPAPNIYINGLPPHFSEQELFALARQFGQVKSVRTFTRHVSEKPTGYGFVLFNDIESAEKCIEGLRKYRNLHPSFSKQIHRIPGTIYAQQSIAQPTEQDPASFKTRMEKLKDEHSTNLYIEGLPLSIDDESLATLVAPYKIKSSRFFKTKLSDPPRIIAFVRLETRIAAQDTIERLHGQMVRGWNDPGCRISVRFADSAEQRELRRTERMVKGEDQSPSRLTIAQAALLNLRGQDLHAHAGPPHKVASTLSSQHEVDVPLVGSRRGGTASQRPLCQTSSLDYLPASRSLPANLAHCDQYSSPVRDHTSPDMDALMQSIKSVGIGGDGGIFDSILGEYHAAPPRTRTLANARVLSAGATPQIALTQTQTRAGQTQARNGFTPTEEMILQAHARRLQLQAHHTSFSTSNGGSGSVHAAAFERDILRRADTSSASASASASVPPVGPSLTRNMNLHPVVDPPPDNGPASSSGQLQLLPLGRFVRTAKSSPEFQFLPTISEDDSVGWTGETGGCLPARVTRPTARGGGGGGTVGTMTPPLSACTDEEKASTTSGTAERVLVRSQTLAATVTVPPCVRLPLPLPVISRPSLSPSSSSSLTADTQQAYHHHHHHLNASAVASSGTVRSSSSGDSQAQGTSARTPRVGVNVSVNNSGGGGGGGFGSRIAVHTTGAGMSPSQLEDASMSASAVVSPALTTCSSRTPSTLSPATPFVGSFGCALHDAFDSVVVGIAGGGCHEDDGVPLADEEIKSK